jgi:cytoskeletal protein CcmA (bactofilin family)
MAVVEGTTASIGKSVQIRGEVRGSEDLLVEGFVEGTITLQESRLTVGANARVQADCSARDVILLGTVIGNIVATGRVELRSGAMLTGDIQASRLSIEENAGFSGKVDLVQSAAGTHGASPTVGAPAAAIPQAAR